MAKKDDKKKNIKSSQPNNKKEVKNANKTANLQKKPTKIQPKQNLNKQKESSKKPAITNNKPANKKQSSLPNKEQIKSQSKSVDNKQTTIVSKSEIKEAMKNADNMKSNNVPKAVQKTIKNIDSKNKKGSEKKFENRANIDKLYVFFTIVNAGVADSVVKIFEDMGSSVSFIQNGKGTASQEMREALHISDVKKEVVISIIRESRLEDIEKEINAFFLASKRNKGVAFAIKMDAVQGIRLYKFLSQTL